MEATNKIIEDPVCGMILEKPEEYTLIHKSETYHFCSSACKRKFEASPKAFTKVKAA